MKIQINTDKHISPSEQLFIFVRSKVEGALGHFSGRVTTVEVHLADENSDKEGAADKRCTVEVRVAKLKPIAVTEQADTIEQAITGATGKVKRAIENSLGKLEK